MSRFFKAGSSDSESESSDDEDIQRNQKQSAPVTRAAYAFSDDEDDTKRIVKSQKDKRYEALQQCIKQMKNSMKIKDNSKVLTEFENLVKIYTKSKTVVEKEGIPGFFVKTLANLEDYVKEQWEDREGRQKLAKINAKGLATLRQKLKRYTRDFETVLTDCRENPDKYLEEEEEEEVRDKDSDSDDDDDEDSRPKLAATSFLKKESSDAKKAAGDLDSDSDFNDSDDSDDSSDDDFQGIGVGEMTAAMFLKDKDKGDAKSSKRQKKEKPEKKEAKVIADIDDGGEWTEVKSAADKIKALFPKDTEINHQNVLKKLYEISSARGKKSTDKLEQINYFKELRSIADIHNLGPAMNMKIQLNIIAAIFDSTSSVDSAMKADIWTECMVQVQDLLTCLEKNPEIFISENVSEASENVDDLESPLRVQGCPLVVVERMNEEFTKILQSCDCHSTEYVDRLKDENVVVGIIKRLQTYFNEGSPDQQSRVYILRIEHMYYKLDLKGLKEIKEQMDKENEGTDKKVNQPTEKTIETSAEEPAKVETKEELPTTTTTTEEDNRNKVKTEDEIEIDDGANDAQIIDELCKFIYTKATDRIRTRAMLCHIYHHALHDRWYAARDLMLISHLQETINHSDVATQILYNRTMVQIGLCAFRHGMIKDAHIALHDIQATGRAKELLAQGLMNLKNTERTPEQERIEKRRLMPFHMHINLELLECVYLTAAMLLEIPYMAAHEFDYRRKIISKSFQHQLRISDKQALIGPPESMREHIVAAAKAMKTGDWKQCCEYILSVKCWNLFRKSETVKQMIRRKIQEEGLRTYLFTYNKIYDSISMHSLANMFDLEGNIVHSTISKMIINEELQASWDEPTQSLILHHGAEPTHLQSLALQLAEKVGNLVDLHERITDYKYGNYNRDRGNKEYQGKGDRRNQGGRYRGNQRNQNNNN